LPIDAVDTGGDDGGVAGRATSSLADARAASSDGAVVDDVDTDVVASVGAVSSTKSRGDMLGDVSIGGSDSSLLLTPRRSRNMRLEPRVDARTATHSVCEQKQRQSIDYLARHVRTTTTCSSLLSGLTSVTEQLRLLVFVLGLRTMASHLAAAAV
jgi:hypothetical protein